jgi:hypothetical protein
MLVLDETYKQLTFKDINGLVEQNVQLRSLVRNLSDQVESREMEFKVGPKISCLFVAFVCLAKWCFSLKTFFIVFRVLIAGKV